MQQRKHLQRKIQAKKPAKSKADIMLSEKPALSKKEQERLDYAFIEAAKNDNKEEMVRLIKAGANIIQDLAGWSALHHAADYGHTEACALIIDLYSRSGGDVKELIATKINGDKTSLYVAANAGHAETCKLLIREYAKAGGNVKELIFAKDRIDHKTALQSATSQGSPKTMDLLRSMENLSEIMGKESFNAFMTSFSECAAT